MQELSDKLQSLVQAGKLSHDQAQINLAKKLDEVLSQIKQNKKGFFTKPKPVKGLYIWGDVGRGKSMLMDMFFEKAKIKAKSRVHFHAFMQNIHADINKWRKLDKGERRKRAEYVRGAGDDPIAPVAKAIALKTRLLCFDEFHVSDIADAMILSRLFSALFARGIIIIATSNRAPDDLYKNGLNRQLFLPFIDLLKHRLDIIELGGAEDYRLAKLSRAPVYYYPLDDETRQNIEKIWARMTRIARPEKIALTVQGRKLELLAASGTARAGFEDLCDAALGAADYLEIARNFSTLILENVPIMQKHDRNQAKRFVTLIDALYEARTKLVISAAAAPDKLYIDGDGSFEFDRTVSRLMEMQSNDYLALEHKGA